MSILTRLQKRLSRRKPKIDDPSALLPLLKADFPKIDSAHLPALPTQGWTTVTLAPHDPLQEALQSLFQASKHFFDLPREYKSQFLTREGSEDGWNCIPGEKEFITLRTLPNTPDSLKEPATLAWRESGTYLDSLLASIAQSLSLPPSALTQYSTPCSSLTEQKTATMLRLFRYEGSAPKVVAEPHADLGLLSFVIGDTPGLEVWNVHTRGFWDVERSYAGAAKATVLGGRQLERLTNGRYVAGGHRVVAYGDGEEGEMATAVEPTQRTSRPKYRYSIVFVLRAHSPVGINTDDMTTAVTGVFARPMRDITAGQLFAETKGKHFNINTNIAERDEQKRKILGMREGEGRSAGTG